MEVSARISNGHFFEGKIMEIIPFSTSYVKQASPLETESDKSDVLRAVKLDPAVLEAQVTIETSQAANVSKRCNNQGSKDGRTKEYSQVSVNFEKMLSKHEAALFSLTPVQFDLLMKYTETLRQQRQIIQKQLECAFCKNNGESATWYATHCLKDSRGRVRCPVLRGYRCPMCGANGDRAHTIKYCPRLRENLNSCSKERGRK